MGLGNKHYPAIRVIGAGLIDASPIVDHHYQSLNWSFHRREELDHWKMSKLPLSVALTVQSGLLSFVILLLELLEALVGLRSECKWR